MKLSLNTIADFLCLWFAIYGVFSLCEWISDWFCIAC